MLLEALPGVPPWLVAGMALGTIASLVVAGIFVAGESLFPTAPQSTEGRVDGTARRREEIRAYLRAIGEPFAEDYPYAGTTVAFYLTDRDVAITFDPQIYLRLGVDDPSVVFCEHEMPGAHLGRRLPFDVAEPRYAPSPDDPVSQAFATLRLDPNAGVDAVTTAYRERVKEVHPDRGGDEESFRRVRDAYATARTHAEK